MKKLEAYKLDFLNHLKSFSQLNEPKTLYNPINYILELGGKRLRPMLTLITADIFNNNHKDALNAALAIEVFHNFSLVHDDIMDDAPLRRGKTTVHEKWSINSGILSGDAMLILAYQLFESYTPNTFQALAKLFSKTALQVCEGQQYDIDFETYNTVTINQYLKMITYKTAVLIGAAMQMGAIVAKASIKDQISIYQFGENLGIAFQLQDDYLDAFGNPDTFGKQVGGDIIENKKTYLYLKALEFASEKEKHTLLSFYNKKSENNTNKVNSVKTIFKNTGASKATLNAVESYTNKAFAVLNNLSISDDKKQLLKLFGSQLMKRSV